MSKMIKSPALAAKRPGGGLPPPAMTKTPPMALKKGGLAAPAGVKGSRLKSIGAGAPADIPPMPGYAKGGCVKMAKGGMARGFGAAKGSANKFKGSC